MLLNVIQLKKRFIKFTVLVIVSTGWAVFQRRMNSLLVHAKPAIIFTDTALPVG